MNSQPQWLLWAQKLQALSQNGLTYTENPFDVDRYEQIKEVAAEMIASGGQVDLPEVKQLFDAQVGYQTPKVDSRGVVFRGDEILLVRELSDGMWTLPGGWVDVNEPPSRAVEREVWEESGYVVRARKMIAVYDRNLHGHTPYLFHIYKLFIECELLGGEPTASIETGEATFYPEDAIPPLSNTRTTLEEIHRAFMHHYNPDLSTEFD